MADPIRVPTDSSLADAIAPRDKVKMLIIGSDGRKPQIAALAAQVAENARQPNGFNPRVAIWIMTVTPNETAVLDQLKVLAPYPDVVVLKRDNSLGDTANDNGGSLDAITLEQMFLNAEA